MICEQCSHKDICIHKEDCNRLERSLQPYKVSETFELKIECKHREFKPAVRTSDLKSYQMP